MRALKGQHFLVDKNIAEKIVSAADVKNTDYVLEIGPGKGILTEKLFQLAKKLFAIEIDALLCSMLYEKFKGNAILIERGAMDTEQLERKFNADSKVVIINTDATKFNYNIFHKYQPLKIVSNLPYYITGKMLYLLFTFPWVSAVLMLQKEVGERLCATSGNKQYGIPSIIVQIHSEVQIIRYVPKTVFVPQPKVDSVVLKFTRRDEKLVEEDIEFVNFIKLSFSHRRKMLINVLSEKFNIEKERVKQIFASLSLPYDTRAEEIPVDKFISLYYKMRSSLA
jgi:16S rRNA (adenine1518-N6/adenine1519-N6)-dimethyltransferase